MVQSLNPKIDLARYGTRIEHEINVELNLLAYALFGEITRNAPVGADGVLRGSFHVEPYAAEDGFGVTIGSPLEYAAYVEFGTRPHWAPLEPLIRYVEEKIQPHVLAVAVSFPGEGKHAKPGRATKKMKGADRVVEIMRVARLIQLKIAKRGTRAQEYIAKAIHAFGLPFRAIHDADGSRYVVDLNGWLRSILPGVIERTKIT